MWEDDAARLIALGWVRLTLERLALGLINSTAMIDDDAERWAPMILAAIIPCPVHGDVCSSLCMGRAALQEWDDAVRSVQP